MRLDHLISYPAHAAGAADWLAVALGPGLLRDLDLVDELLTRAVELEDTDPDGALELDRQRRDAAARVVTELRAVVRQARES